MTAEEITIMLIDPSLSGAHTKGRILAFMLSDLLEQKMLGTTPIDSDVDVAAASRPPSPGIGLFTFGSH